MTTPIGDLLELLWRDYLALAPQALEIARLLKSRGDTVKNDHLALRTFGHERVDLEILDRAFVDAGYQPIENYEIPSKKLRASHYEHESPGMPRIFISSLILEECSETLRKTVNELVSHVPLGVEADWRFASLGRPWPLSAQTYESLLEESQYAAWLAAFGFRANHFTLAAHSLRSVQSLQELNELLVANGFVLNQEGGVIKGSSEVGLEQSATLAAAREVRFSDVQKLIPACYYEFAFRHKDAKGELFSGFIAESASHLFSSTDRQLN